MTTTYDSSRHDNAHNNTEVTAMTHHNTYFEGAVQSLGFSDDNGRATVGVVEPGDYDFGTAKTEERITVTTGKLTINGREYRMGETCTIPTGEVILIAAEVFSSYVCRYGE